VVKLTILNLFIAIILQRYVDLYNQQHQEFNLDTIKAFMEAWKQFDPKATGFISKHQLEDLLATLGCPLGWGLTIGERLLSLPKAKELYIESLELSLYNDLMDH